MTYHHLIGKASLMKTLLHITILQVDSTVNVRTNTLGISASILLLEVSVDSG